MFQINRKKVTDFRSNLRVVLPRAQSGITESNLQVLRRELEQSCNVHVHLHQGGHGACGRRQGDHPFDLKSNQRKLNGHVSMLIKIFGRCKDWNHDSRMRESMLSDTLAVCPLWLLFKCHKGWEQKSGKVAPSRPDQLQGGMKG